MNTTSNRYQVSIEADPSLPIIRMTVTSTPPRHS
ncbi:MAG: hypothetical protein QOC92_1575 [Acidimicrobiaceae bacterium]